MLKRQAPPSTAPAHQAKVGSGASPTQEKPHRCPRLGSETAAFIPASSGAPWGSAQDQKPGRGPSLQHRPSQGCHLLWLREPRALWRPLCGAPGPFCMCPEKSGLWKLLWPCKEACVQLWGGGQATRTPTPEAWAGRGISNTPPPKGCQRLPPAEARADPGHTRTGDLEKRPL